MKNQKISGIPLFLFFLGLFSFYLFSMITLMMYFSLNEFKVVSEPILYLLHAQEVTFAKRLDLIFVFFWILISILTLINYILTARIIRYEQQKKMKRKKIEIVGYHILIFIVAYFLAPYERIQIVISKQWLSFFIFGLTLPLLIIIWNKVRGSL